MAHASRQTILRYVAGNSGRRVGTLHKARRLARLADKHARHQGKPATNVAKFYSKVASLLPRGIDLPEHHLPRHQRPMKGD